VPGLVRVLGPARLFGLTMTLGLALSLGVGAAAPGSAQGAPAHALEILPGTSGAVSHLMTPSSGALLATTTDGLFRSDDGGDSWRDVPLPARTPNTSPLVVVDPTNHDVIYARGTEGLSKTIDGGASWSVVLPLDDAFPMILSLKISPADPNLIHLILASRQNGLLHVLRSSDGGATWPLIEQYGDNDSMMCYWTMGFVQWHPTDPSRLFQAFSCVHSGDASANLQESHDQARAGAPSSIRAASRRSRTAGRAQCRLSRRPRQYRPAAWSRPRQVGGWSPRRTVSSAGAA